MQRSSRYIWNFPRDEYLFMGLLELDDKGMEIEFYEGTDRCTMLLRLSEDAKGEFEKFSLGNREQRADLARRAEGEDADEESAEFDADCAEMERTANTAGAPTLRFFEDIVKGLDNATIEKYELWSSQIRHPEHWSIADPPSAEVAQVLPICFFNLSFWKRIGLEGCPCARHGWAHARFVSGRGRGAN